MIWNNISKLALGALACLSVAFSGVIKDSLKVDAADEVSWEDLKGVTFSNFPSSSSLSFPSTGWINTFGSIGSHANVDTYMYLPLYIEPITFTQSSYGSATLIGFCCSNGSSLTYDFGMYQPVSVTDFRANWLEWPYRNTNVSPTNASFSLYRNSSAKLFSSGSFTFTSNDTPSNVNAYPATYTLSPMSASDWLAWCDLNNIVYELPEPSYSEGYSEGYASGQSAGHSQGYSEGYASGNSAGRAEGYSEGYADGMSDGNSGGYEEGYSAGYSAGVQSQIDVPQSIKLRLDSQYSISVSGYLDSEYPNVSGTLTENDPEMVISRSSGSKLKLTFDTGQQDWPYPVFRVRFDNYSQILSWNLIENDYIYCPTWVANLVIDVWASNNNALESQFDGLMFDPSSYSYVHFGPRTGVSEIYDQGYKDGADDGYSSGFDVGVDQGRSEGYSNGYGAGYSAGLGAGGTTMQVIDIWGLMSAVITMPFTFFSQGLDWTLFAGSPYEFSVSIFFGSVLVILMLWKIIQLVIGLGK